MDTDKVSLLNFTLQYLADFWTRFGAPVAIHREIETNGRKVVIEVWDKDLGKVPEDAEALKRLEQYSHE